MTSGPRSAHGRSSAGRNARRSADADRRAAGQRDARTRQTRARAARRRTAQLGHHGTRLRGGLVVVLLLLLVIGGRLVYLQGYKSTAYAEEAVEQRLRTTTLLAPRGAITDRNGVPLAMSIDASAVYGEPRVIARATCEPDAEEPCTPGEIAAVLAPVLDLPVEDVQERLSRDSAFVYLARGLQPAVATEVRELELLGIGTLSEPGRLHPGGELAANVLGFTSLDDDGGIKGAAGVELGWNSVLTGQNGRSQAEVDGSGRVIPSGTETVVEPQPGSDVQLTIDRDLQWYAQDVLARQVQASNAESGTAVVMDVSSGEVLALANAPTFDANDPGAAPAELRGNRAITDIFEPGSIGKVITVGAALSDGKVTPDTVLTVPDRIQVSTKNFKDSHDHPTERMTVTGILVESSNVGTIQIAQMLGPERMHEALLNFGLGEKSGLGLPGESRGLVPHPDDWSGPTIGAVAIGQSYSVNAIQMASVYATVANDGVRVTPSVVKAVRNDAGEVESSSEPETRRVLSSEVAAQLRLMLEGVTGESGTAETAAIPGYRVAGKTGTAQRVVDGRYNGYTASFVGFAPADDPQIVVAVSIQAPKNGYYGGAVAGPVFREIMAFALSSQQVPPTGTAPPQLRLRESDPR